MDLSMFQKESSGSGQKKNKVNVNPYTCNYKYLN